MRKAALILVVLMMALITLLIVVIVYRDRITPQYVDRVELSDIVEREVVVQQIRPEDEMVATETMIEMPAGTTDPNFRVENYDPAKAYNGTTLLTDVSDRSNLRVVEVNMLGDVVWEFVVPIEWLPEELEFGFDAERLATGSTLISIPGSGIYEVNSAGELIWAHEDPQNGYDADRLENGNTIYVFGFNDAEHQPAVKEVNSEGQLVWQWIPHTIYGNDYIYAGAEGYAHVNAVQRLTDGNTMVNLRNMMKTAVVETGGAVVNEYDWSAEGVTWPHDPVLNETTGTMMVCMRGESSYAVVEISLETGEMIWSYPMTGINMTHDCNRLPNGNVLLSTVNLMSNQSTLIEVNSAGEIVWQLFHETKLNTTHDDPTSALGFFHKAQRIKP